MVLILKNLTTPLDFCQDSEYVWYLGDFFFQFSNNTQVPGHMAAAYYTSLGAAAVFVQHIAKATHFPLEEAIGQGILHFT